MDTLRKWKRFDYLCSPDTTFGGETSYNSSIGPEGPIPRRLGMPKDFNTGESLPVQGLNTNKLPHPLITNGDKLIPLPIWEQVDKKTFRASFMNGTCSVEVFAVPEKKDGWEFRLLIAGKTLKSKNIIVGLDCVKYAAAATAAKRLYKAALQAQYLADQSIPF
jgi:hypothetical protein